jgi:hypothetical protein
MECPIALEEREPEIKPWAYIRISDIESVYVTVHGGIQNKSREINMLTYWTLPKSQKFRNFG